jgi:hypothetical protein
MPDSLINFNLNRNLTFWTGPSLLILGIGLWHAGQSHQLQLEQEPGVLDRPITADTRNRPLACRTIPSAPTCNRNQAFWTGPSLLILGIGLWHAGQSHNNQLSVSKKIRKTFVSEECLENKYFFPFFRNGGKGEGGGGGSGGLGHLAFTTAHSEILQNIGPDTTSQICPDMY